MYKTLSLYMTNEDIARFVGTHSRTVTRWRVEYGLKHRPSIHEFLAWAAKHPEVINALANELFCDMLHVYRRAQR